MLGLAYVPLAKNVQNWIVDWSTARDFTVYIISNTASYINIGGVSEKYYQTSGIFKTLSLQRNIAILLVFDS